MTLELREARASDFEAIHTRLLRVLEPRVPVDRWRRLFDPGWDTGGEPAGFVLWHGAEPVGFLATLHRPPPADGRSRICNLSSWIVLEEHRGSALRLLSPVLARPDLTLLNLSPTPDVHPIFTGLGFRALDNHRFIAPLRPDQLLRTRGKPRASETSGRVKVVWRADRSQERSGVGGDLLFDHRRRVEAVDLVRRHSKNGTTPEPDRDPVIYSVRRGRTVPSIRLHRVPDPEDLLEALPSLWRGWLRRHRAGVLEYDARVLCGLPVPGARRRDLEVPRLFRSPDRSAAELQDEMYTEVVLLEL